MPDRRPCSIPECGRPQLARGYCPSHYGKWYRYGDPLASRGSGFDRLASLAERLAANTDRSGDPGGCWLWTGATHRPSGYGTMSFGGTSRDAHVWAYVSVYGEVPDGLFVLHACDNPPCVNPAHLRVGTHQENMDDKVEHGRQYRQRGELCPTAKLTEADVCRIRSVRRLDREWAAELGVSSSTVYAARTGKRWAHVRCEEAV